MASSVAAGAHSRAAADGYARQPRGEARRKAILEAAVEVLAKKGQRGLRITELADAVGVTHPNLIYYFGNKERLLREAVEEREREESGFYGVPAELVSLRHLPNAAALIVAHALFTRLYVVLAAESLDPEDPLHDFFVRRYRNARHFVATAIRHDREQGLLRDDIDADQTSYEVLAMLQGLEIQWLMDPDHVDYIRLVQTFTDGFFERNGATVARSVQRRRPDDGEKASQS